MRVSILALVALVLAAAPAHAEDADPAAVAQAVTAGTVRFVATVDAAYVGTSLPLCIPLPADIDPNQALTGTVTDGCFQSSSSGPCALLVVGVNPHTDPPTVAAGPDWMCIEDTIEELVGEFELRLIPS